MMIDISTKDGYNLATALRGPDDSELFVFKAAFTAPLRDLLGANTENGIQGWSFWLDAKDAAMKIQALRDMGLHQGPLAHWEGHAIRGYRSLSTVGHPGFLDVSSKMIAMIHATHSSVGAMQAIFEEFTGWLESRGYLDQARSERAVSDMIARQ